MSQACEMRMEQLIHPGQAVTDPTSDHTMDSTRCAIEKPMSFCLSDGETVLWNILSNSSATLIL
eukprot:2572981-Pyramimonas_sp.AAC.1